MKIILATGPRSLDQLQAGADQLKGNLTAGPENSTHGQAENP
jgi:hypothetical protein